LKANNDQFTTYRESSSKNKPESVIIFDTLKPIVAKEAIQTEITSPEVKAGLYKRYGGPIFDEYQNNINQFRSDLSYFHRIAKQFGLKLVLQENGYLKPYLLKKRFLCQAILSGAKYPRSINFKDKNAYLSTNVFKTIHVKFKANLGKRQVVRGSHNNFFGKKRPIQK
jgi:hypothetical protein